ncbi:MAG TPA: transposase [Bryobacteraceae bacterium]
MAKLKQGRKPEEVQGVLQQITKAVLEDRAGRFRRDRTGNARDRNGEFSPQIIQKNQTRWTGFDDKILSMYARGHDHARDPRAT